MSLSRCQAVVGLLTGILSIAGAAYSLMPAFKPVSGEVVAVIREARSDRPVPDAVVEILTPKDALVTTLTPEHEGRARHKLKEGAYRFRVTHPRYATEVRQIEVMAGQTAEVRVRLAPRAVTAAPQTSSATSSSDGVGRAVNAGVSSLRRLFQ